MNEYYVKYFDKGIIKVARDIKSREYAEKLAKLKDSDFGTFVGWREIEINKLEPFQNANIPEEFVYGNVVRVIKQFNNGMDEYVGSLAIISGSFASLCTHGTTIKHTDLRSYKLSFIDGGESSWWNHDKLQFISVGDPILINLWLKKYHLKDPDDSICLIDEIKKIGK